jgi:hypothetical protein
LIYVFEESGDEMGKLFFYSDQIVPENKWIDEQFMLILSNKNAKIGYIPSMGDGLVYKLENGKIQ